jgi:hypothetical protein
MICHDLSKPVFTCHDLLCHGNCVREGGREGGRSSYRATRLQLEIIILIWFEIVVESTIRKTPSGPQSLTIACATIITIIAQHRAVHVLSSDQHSWLGFIDPA